MRKILFNIVLLAMTMTATAQSWPTPTTEAKPGTRWWWLGSAVDKANLKWNLEQYAGHGIGTVEITPLYGVQGNRSDGTVEGKNIDFLTDKWFEMLKYTMIVSQRNGIEVDMATGTGWPFGGPWVPLKETACRVVFVEKMFEGNEVTDLDLTITDEKERKNAFLDKVMLYNGGEAIDITEHVDNQKLTLKHSTTTSSHQNKVIAVYIKYGVMKVKRAAPGGEGWVIDHFDRNAVKNYLNHISDAFNRTGTPYPHTFFNDSYEVSEGDWTPTLFKEFESRRGYKLENHLPELISQDPQVLSDYRETLGDLVLENFTEQWTAWAHAHGAITRNQAHGSPANLIDCYAAVDIPEIEGFGLSEFGIKGLRKDPGKTRKNDSDFSMLKYASSAAHICGKPYTSSETFTWLTEHFRTSLSQLKPDIDLMFCAGVNHMFFHGTCYSPQNDVWPGWKFYASIDMSPTNSIWRDAPYFMDYVERCQSFLQWGEPDNDFLVYLPIRDMWKQQTGKRLMQFSIHAMGQLAPDFIKSILEIDKAGFDCDYISERLLMNVSCHDGILQTKAGTQYKGLIIPGSGEMPDKVKKHIDNLKEQGAHIIYGINAQEMAIAATPEPMRKIGLKAIRRKNPNGYHYFIVNLTPNDIHTVCDVAVNKSIDALWFNPVTGEITPATADKSGWHIDLRSGESMILQTFEKPLSTAKRIVRPATMPQQQQTAITISGPWTLTFIEEAPKVGKTYQLQQFQSWETIDEQTKTTMGTGVYTTNIKLTKKQLDDGNWLLDLGDVRESARVYINGHFIGCAWSVPFILDTKGILKVGNNELRIEVTNLPANRIADLDRQGVKWRKMEEINVVDINYKKTLYDQWTPVPSGLNTEVKLIKK